MRKKNSSSQQVMVLVILLSILLVALVYFRVFKVYEDKAKSIKDSNNELRQQVEQLKDYYDKQEDYINKTEELKADIRNMLESFPELVLEEDIMMLGVKTMNDADEANVTAINILDPEAIYTIAAEEVGTVDLSVEENDKFSESRAVNILKDESSYVIQCDAKSLKTVIKTILDKPEKSVIKNILFSKNEEFNNLEGTVEVDFFYLPVYGKEYVPVDMKEYAKGLELLFKLREKEEETEEEE